ncbi:MAG: hypothetical protein J6M30_00045 [Bacteroidales bacterium]|nr:hypothetical protein [Bacteroidales bacterium]
MELLKRYIIYILLLFAALPQYFGTKAAAQTANVYDLQTPLIIRSLNTDAYSDTSGSIYMQKNGKDGHSGRLIINLNTLNQENISVSWTNNTLKSSKNKWFVRLQYRLNSSDEWKNVTDKRGRNVEFVTQSKRISRTFDDIILDASCNNKSCIQLCWLIDAYSANKSGYPEIMFKNIEISSDYDKYFGLPAKISVYMNGDDEKNEVNSLIFDKIPLHYVYPSDKRIVISGENIRDSISLKIEGDGASAFSLSQTSIPAKQNLQKTVNIIYNPKKEGKHRAELIISTDKLMQRIEIPIEGFCAKQVAYDVNLLPGTIAVSDNSVYNIPVFSNMDYQYRFTQNKDKLQNIYIYYKWYRDRTLLSQQCDTAKSINYCLTLTTPPSATNLEIHLSAGNEIIFDEYYFGSPKVKTMVKSGLWSQDDNWLPSGSPKANDFVVIGKGVRAKVDTDADCKMLILDDSSNVSINTGKIFYVSSDIYYNKNSWFSVHQYLLPGRWNYISSPVNQARAAIFSMKNLSSDNDTWFMQYNTGIKSKMDDYWSDYITDPEYMLIPGKGYAVYTHGAMDVKYEGLLCNSAINIALVSSEEDRWNLVGNPYTAPLSSKKLFEDIDGKIQGNTIMLFDRQTKVYNPLIIDSKQEVTIPSLESFFVEALPEPTEITFKRTHQYIPDEKHSGKMNANYLNLSVSKDKSWQYALLGMDERSEYGFDEYDCHKMFGNNPDMPDIYLVCEGEELSVNVFPDYPAVYDVGLYIGNPSEVEIGLNNVTIMPDYVMIFLEDKQTGEFFNFCDRATVRTYLNSGTTERYRIHILKSVDKDILGKDSYDIFLWSDKNRILYFNKEASDAEKIRIYKNNTIAAEHDVPSNQVYTFSLDKGVYNISLYINGQWSKMRECEIK